MVVFSRGVCTVDSKNQLTAINEHTQIERQQGIILAQNEIGEADKLEPQHACFA